MGALIPNDRKNRFFLCILLIALSLLLLGAGQIRSELKERNLNKKLEKDKWLEIVSSMSDELPLEHKKEWVVYAKANPQIFLRASTIELKAGISY